MDEDAMLARESSPEVHVRTVFASVLTLVPCAASPHGSAMLRSLLSSLVHKFVSGTLIFLIVMASKFGAVNLQSDPNCKTF